VIASIVTLGVVCTAIAFLVFAALIEAVGPVRATVITYVNPAVAAVLGVVVLNETLTPAMILGFVLVTVGSVLATRRPAVAQLVALDQPGA
jgi:drug/metabolite transporter (DMT)-like permease